MSKLLSLAEAAARVRDGDVLALGGNILHRSPFAFARELARQGRRGLQLVKTAGGYDIDLLCAAGCVAVVHAGCVGLENEFGFAPNYRRAVEEGRVESRENACYTVIASLRAAAYGIPFQPVNALWGSDLPQASDFRLVKDPYTGQEVYAIPALRPDWAVIHVPEADEQGNARILGCVFEDVIMTRAARGVIVTAERIVATEAFRGSPETIAVPHFMVTAVVEEPGGAAPGSCYPSYDYDPTHVRRYLALAADPQRLAEYLRATR
jgi:glutaconate CoA-transferase subunit A